VADVLLCFATNAETMLATRALKQSGFTLRMVATPANVSPSSNLSLSIDASAEAGATSALASLGMPIHAIVK